MKTLNKITLILLSSIFSATSFAQTSAVKQKIYAAFPESFSIDEAFMVDAFSNKSGNTVSLNLADNFHFNGTVIVNQMKYDNLQTIMIRSSENNESIFQISKITNNDKTITYTGRIINNNAADGYVIKNNNGIYSLQKFETDKILEHCKL
jgi:hypothetical protein